MLVSLSLNSLHVITSMSLSNSSLCENYSHRMITACAYCFICVEQFSVVCQQREYILLASLVLTWHAGLYFPILLSSNINNGYDSVRVCVDCMRICIETCSHTGRCCPVQKFTPHSFMDMLYEQYAPLYIESAIMWQSPLTMRPLWT